jgi:hypothetical protein
MNSHLRVLVLCFWLFFLAFRPVCVVASTTSTRPSHHLLSPERHTTFFRPKSTHLLGTPPSFGCGDIFGGNLGATSLRDTGFFGTFHVSHTTTLRPSGTPRPSGTLGLWARPIPTHNLGSSIGQAFQSHLFGTDYSLRNHLVWPPGQPPPPPTALLVSLSTHHLQPRLYPHLLRSTSSTDKC